MRILIHPDNPKRCIIEDWHRSTFLLLTGIPSTKRWVGRALHFEPTGSAIQYILDTFPDATWEHRAAGKRDTYLATVESGKLGSALKVQPTIDAGWDGFKTEPYEHQRRAFAISKDREAFALFFEQGCGKTKVVLDNAAYLHEKKEIQALIIIAPNGVHRNWIDKEVPEHLPDRVARHAVFFKSSMSTSALQRWMMRVSSAGSSGKLLVLAFNVEAFSNSRHDKARNALTSLLTRFRSMLVVDESSRIRTPGAERTKFITKTLREMAPYRRILSGTPAPKGLENMYSQYLFLDPNILGYTSFWTFRNQYCIMGGFNGKVIVGYRQVPEFIERTDGHTMRVLKKDALDLPPKIYKRMPFELAPEQRRVYNEMRDTFLAQYKDDQLTASVVIAQLIRLTQISAGWWPGEQGASLQQFPTNPRLDALRTVLEDTEGKAIIWSRFPADLDMLYQELGPGQCVRYHGSVPERERAEAILRFQDPSSSVRYFLGNPQAAGIGLTLTAAETAIYYTNTLDLELREQSEDRCHRIGTVNPVVYWDLEAINTIDRRVLALLKKKKLLAESILGDPRSFFLEEEQSND